MTDVIPPEDRPHRVSATLGVDPDPETTGIAPENRAQGNGRPDDDAHAERVAASEAARYETGSDADLAEHADAMEYSADDVPTNATDVVAWIKDAEDADDRAARVAAAGAVEAARDGGPRSTVLDELNR